MSIRNLHTLFEPKTIAVIGASERVGSLGTTVWQHCAEGGYAGALLPVNPKYRQIGGKACHKHVRDLPANVDLALVCTPVNSTAGVLAELGQKGVKAAVVLSELSAIPADRKEELEQAMRDAARPTLMRILGPGFMGLRLPKIGVCASAYRGSALAGDLAFVSQSASVAAGVLEWASNRNIGFSRFISLGASVDIDVGDVLDYLANDGETRAILLYIEKVEQARKFLSAARAAARSKPVVVIKPRHLDRGTDSDDICADKIYDAVFRRAGMLRVASMADLFSAAETLAFARDVCGERLAIISNGKGLGLLAADALVDAGGQIAANNEIADAVCPEGRQTEIGAIVDTYIHALAALLRDRSNDCVLLIHSSMSAISAEVLVDAIIPMMPHASRPLLTCWMGTETSAVRRELALAHVPVYDAPEQAARGFMQMAQYKRNQRLLMQAPESLGIAEANRKLIPTMISAASMQKRNEFINDEAKQLLTVCGFRTVQSFTGSAEITIHMHTDVVFGPVIAIGKPMNRMTSVAGLPPLNSVLAADMILNSGLSATDAKNGAFSAHQLNQIEFALIQISHMVTEIGEINSLKVNLAFADQFNPVVTDAHIRIGAISGRAAGRLAIRPYPKELEHEIEWQGQALMIRPIKPEDGTAHLAFFSALTPEDVRFRMFTNMRELQPAQLARMTQIDYDREMALIATRTGDDGVSVTLGVVRVIADPDNELAEFAVTVRSDLKTHGLGTILMREIIDYCRQRGIKEIVGDALANNTRLLNMVTRLGFEVTPRIGDDTMMLRLPLQ